MKNFIKRFSFICMSLILSLGAFAGCAKSSDVPEWVKTALPDYSAGEEYKFFTYTGPTDGYYTHDGVLIFTEDLQTVERYKEYKEAGLNMLMLTGNAGYADGEVWEESQAYKCFTNAYAAGITDIILNDGRLQPLIDSFNLVGDKANGYRFSETDENEDGISDELYAYVKSCLETYYQMPGFKGVRLGDEPDYDAAPSYGKVYRALKAAGKELGIDNLYIHLNLFPINAGDALKTFAPEEVCMEEKEVDGVVKKVPKEDALTIAYTYYIESFLKETGADRLAVDIYFFKGSGFSAGTYACLQIFQRACKKYNVTMSFCLQSFEMLNGTNTIYDLVDKNCMFLELNTMVGMGMRHFAYYTYLPGVSVTTDGGKFLERGSFLTRSGERTNIYYYAQDTMAAVQKIAKMMSYYEFLGSKIYTAEVATFDNTPYMESYWDEDLNDSITFDNSYVFNQEIFKGFTFDNDIAFVTELKDEENDLYMYMAQNIVDPRCGKDGDTGMTVTVQFDSSYEYVAEFDCGNLTYRKLNNGKYTTDLAAGYAVYLIPLKNAA